MTTLVPALPAQLSAALASELAMQLEPAAAVFARYGIDDDMADLLLANRQFRAMLQQAKQAWAQAENATERVRLKAIIAVEEMLPDMFSRATDRDTPANSANDIFKTFKSLAGMDAKEAVVTGGGGGFALTINLTDGGPKREITIEAAPSPTEEVTPPEQFTMALQELIEGVKEVES